MVNASPRDSFERIKAQLDVPKRVVITAGMPYANGPIHLGHLAGAFVPADIFARWWRMVVGDEHVLFVSGSDDHGVTSVMRAADEHLPINEYIQHIRTAHLDTFRRYHISLNHYGSTSDAQHLKSHTGLCQDFFTGLKHQQLLSVRSTQQWFDKSRQLFLPDRLVVGTCPVCGDDGAYSQECDRCGAQYSPEELVDPVSSLSGRMPILRETRHLWLDMYPLAPVIMRHLATMGRKTYQKSVLAELLSDIAPGLSFCKHSSQQLVDQRHYMQYQGLLSQLGKHKQRFGAHHKVSLEFCSYDDLAHAETLFRTAEIPYELNHSWSQRSMSRDVSWGLRLPTGLGLDDAELDHKTIYVWPESLIAPVSFTEQALRLTASAPSVTYKDYWYAQDAVRHQFIGIDNVYFYGVMQTALWLAQRADPYDLTKSDAELQLSQIHTFFHLQVSGHKMSKSRGNFFTADQVLTDDGRASDQMRYFLAFLSLKQKPANFDIKLCQQRSDFLAGPLNAAIEKPLSAARKQFGGRVPDGQLLPKVVRETEKILKITVTMMPQSKYPQFLLAVENYARLINSLFAIYKPHDDRYPAAARRDALYSCFFILKNLVILLAPFAPGVMDELRQSLALDKTIYAFSELAVPMSPGHQIEATPRCYFGAAAEVMSAELLAAAQADSASPAG